MTSLAAAMVCTPTALAKTMPLEAFSAHGPMPSSIEGEKLRNPMHVVGFMTPFNFSGHPAAVLRTGFSTDGLPLGIQIVAERHRDDLVLQLCHAYEQAARPFDAWPSPEEILESATTASKM
jgi:aspartyl-tRNA(Asn)/glutamyl-tRNA(Gln) amidotransferase subunit A